MSEAGVTVTGRDLQEVRCKVMDRERNVVRVVPVANGYALYVEFEGMLGDYGRTPGYREQCVCKDVMEVRDILHSALNRQASMEAAYAQGWRPNTGSMQPPYQQAEEYLFGAHPALKRAEFSKPQDPAKWDHDLGSASIGRLEGINAPISKREVEAAADACLDERLQRRAVGEASDHLMRQVRKASGEAS